MRRLFVRATKGYYHAQSKQAPIGVNVQQRTRRNKQNKRIHRMPYLEHVNPPLAGFAGGAGVDIHKHCVWPVRFVTSRNTHLTVQTRLNGKRTHRTGPAHHTPVSLPCVCVIGSNIHDLNQDCKLSNCNAAYKLIKCTQRALGSTMPLGNDSVRLPHSSIRPLCHNTAPPAPAPCCKV